MPGLRTQVMGLVGLCISMATALAVSRMSFGSPIRNQESILDWDLARERFAVFFEWPCPDNAVKLLNSLRRGEVSKEKGDRSGTMELIDRDYSILETEAVAGNRYAAEVLFRLLSISDGALTGYILQTMGTIIRVNPILFLDMALKYRESGFLGYRMPVYGITPGYVDNTKARRYEYEMRIRALEGVTGEKYSEVIAESVAELKSLIKRLYCFILTSF